MPHDTSAAWELFTRYTVAVIPRQDPRAAIDQEIAALIAQPGPVRDVAANVVHAAFVAAGWTLIHQEGQGG